MLVDIARDLMQIVEAPRRGREASDGGPGFGNLVRGVVDGGRRRIIHGKGGSPASIFEEPELK